MRPTGPATIARIRATLRKAFNDALARKVVSGIPNPAALVKTSNARAKPIVWEPERVERWRATGAVPGPVMVWTDNLLVQFLDYAADHDPDPDPDTVAVLTAYKARRAAWRLAAGTDWPDTKPFFVRPDGKPWHPNAVPNASAASSNEPGCHPSACTPCATAPPPSPSTLASTSKSSPTNSATPPRHSPATLTRASSSGCTMKPQPPSPAGSRKSGAVPLERPTWVMG
ncbi:hypothetical protein [Micromonospora kangleipakensis]|uniref:hypothetical protein n=1 Tax=Micromonospora kangleipakensis TaxID=1077942 RepID=UPI003BF7F3EF